jgi:hypothetical protein
MKPALSSKRRRRIIAELRSLAARNSGVLVPAIVIDRARSPRSPLHAVFQWDDTKAAAEFRLWQARELIQRTFRVISINGRGMKVRVFVSLKPDRYCAGGGYREMTFVLANRDMRCQLLKDAIEEMKLFSEKYASLRELARVFQAIRSVRKQLHD